MTTRELIEDTDGAAGAFDPVSPNEVPIMLLVLLLSFICAHIFTCLGMLLGHGIHSSVYVMCYLIGVLYVSIRSSRRTALLASFLSVLIYDFFHVTPLYSLMPSDRQYYVVVIFMFVVAVTVNELAYRARFNEFQANKLRQEAESEKLKNTLLRSVSHDLKSPLTSIMGAATLLSDESEQPLSDALKRELAQSIAFESARLNRIVSNLLDMTRLESGGVVLHRDWYHLDELLANSIASIETRYGAQNIEVEFEEPMPLLYVDPLLIEQLLTNILDNCVKYAPDKAYSVRAKAEGGDLFVSIHNQGSSLEGLDSEKLFEKFYRGGGTESSAIPGAGLGLAICHSVVALHEGEIHFENENEKGGGDGVTLTFRLPLPEESPVIELEPESDIDSQTEEENRQKDGALE